MARSVTPNLLVAVSLQSNSLNISAVAFCYFEALVRNADPYKFEEEVTRLKSFRNIMTDGGFDEAIYVDFAEEAWDLLHKLATVPVDTGLAIVLETFNDYNISMAMITYFKVMDCKHRTTIY
jgi:ubiquitin thioesterase protein OTUB1